MDDDDADDEDNEDEQQGSSLGRWSLQLLLQLILNRLHRHDVRFADIGSTDDGEVEDVL